MRFLPKILITAGPTREMLDPVRFISNLSTGEMGYALAEECRSQKFKTTLISGPTSLKPPGGVRFVPVMSASEMQRACEKYFPGHDILIMTAAVCDFTAAKPAKQKIRRTRTKQFLLKRTPDIIASLGKKKGNRIVIGFCLETENWIENAKGKIRRKNLDGIAANYYNPTHNPFGNRKIRSAFIDRAGRVQLLPQLSKKQIAKRLLAWIGKLHN